MLFKPELAKLIIEGRKTQTRRLAKGINLAVDIHGNPGATDNPYFKDLGPIKAVTKVNGRLLWEVGKSYAICPGRGKPVMWWRKAATDIPVLVEGGSQFMRIPDLMERGYKPARIKITSIRFQSLHDINEKDAKDEGFAGRSEFLIAFHNINKNTGIWTKVWALTFEVE